MWPCRDNQFSHRLCFLWGRKNSFITSLTETTPVSHWSPPQPWIQQMTPKESEPGKPLPVKWKIMTCFKYPIIVTNHPQTDEQQKPTLNHGINLGIFLPETVVHGRNSPFPKRTNHLLMLKETVNCKLKPVGSFARPSAFTATP